MTGFLSGCATAMITPFTQTGVNFNAFEQMIEFQLEGGTDALVVLGTTGEPCTMSETEKTALLKCAVKRKGKAKILAGTGSNDTKKAILSSKRAEDTGADGLLVVTPYYNKCTQAGLIAYYEAIAAAVSIPVICYNVPSRTGVNILPETMAEIAKIPNVAGIKEACGNMVQIMATARAIRGKCDLYSGDDALNLPILCAGGTAVISVISNLVPEETKRLVTQTLSGNLREANRLNDLLLPLIDACFCEVNPIPVKEGLNLLGFQAGTPRPPLTQIETKHREQLKQALEGVLKERLV